MFSYDNNNPKLIIACNFEGINIANIDPNKIFHEGSTWADRKLLYETIKAYAALSG